MSPRRGALGVALWLAAAASAAETPADLVLRGGAVYTVDAARSRAQAVAVRDGRIAWVGSDRGAASWIGAATRVVDLDGGMLLPGFQDAHVHAVSGYELLQCDLSELPDEAAILAKVARCAAAPGEWLIGEGWELAAFDSLGPRREALDAVTGDRPALLTAFDGHSAWANTAALRRAGVDADTPDPEAGRIERDPDTGEPSGTLRESAIDLVERLVPEVPLERRVAGLELALERLAAAGVTAFQEGWARWPELEAYAALERRGGLTLRARVALRVDEGRGAEQVPELLRLRERYERPGLRLDTAKIFVDGVIEGRTAAMLAPYLDRPGDAGTPRLSPKRLTALVAALSAAGFDVHAHAIGDRAVRMVLDAVEAAGPAGRGPERRPQIAHAQVIDPADVARFRRLGVIAVFQPLWAYPDRYITELTWPGLGPERSAWIYPMGSLVAAGAPIAFGSDWNVTSLEPLRGIEVAVTRRDPDAGGDVMQPEQRLDLATALAAYTIGAAWALGSERETGSIEVGKRADLVWLAADLFEGAPSAIAGVGVRATLAGGAPVFLAEDLAWPGAAP